MRFSDGLPSIMILSFLVGFAVCETPDNSTNTLILRYGSGKVFRVDINDSDFKTATVFESVEHLLIVPKGWFLFQEKEGKWYRGNIGKPEELSEAKLPKDLWGSLLGITLSNSGDKLACIQHRRGQARYDLHIYDLNTGARRTVAHQQPEMQLPSWSPDDSQVAFYLRELGKFALITVTIEGGQKELREIVRPLYGFPNVSSMRHVRPSWSPDGRKIIFEGKLKGSYMSIVDSDGKNITPSVWGKWSPDGKKLFGVVTEKTREGERDVLTVTDVPSGKKEKLNASLPAQGIDKWEYSLDGTLVAILMTDGILKIMDTFSGTTRDVPGVSCHSPSGGTYSSDMYWVQLAVAQPLQEPTETQEPEKEKQKLLPPQAQRTEEATDSFLPGLTIAGVVLAGVVVFLLLRRKRA